MRVLLICTKFFGYELQIRDCLVSLGHDVFLLGDRVWNGFWGKALARIAPRSYRYFNCLSLQSVLEREVPDTAYFDRIIVVQGVAVNAAFLSRLRRRMNGGKIVLYLWDAVANRKNSLDLIKVADKVYSFDPKDCKNYGLHYKPLFFGTRESFDREQAPLKFQLCFVGTDRGDRYLVTKRVVENAGLSRVYTKFFVENSLKIVWRRLVLFLRVKINRDDFFLSPIKYDDVIKRMSESEVILDVEHRRQNGLTIRTMEALGMGKKLITSNRNVVQHDFFNPRNIFVVDRASCSVPASFWRTSYEPVPEEILLKYSIRSWVLGFLK